MEYGQVNFLAVFVAAIAGFVVGPLWYGPLFGKKWMELAGITTEDAEGGNASPHIFTFVGFFFLAYAIARIMSFGHMSGVWWGVVTAVFVWAGQIMGDRQCIQRSNYPDHRSHHRNLVLIYP